MNKKDFNSLETLGFSIFRDMHTERVYPNWMLRYFETLTESEQRVYFHSFRQVTDQMYSEDYLIDRLKWILKYPAIEMEYDLYVHAKLDLDFYYPAVFKPEKWIQLEEKYFDRFNEDILSVLESQENQAFSPNDSGDTHPF